MKTILTLLIYALSPIPTGILHWSLFYLVVHPEYFLKALSGGFVMSIFTEMLFFPAAFLTGIVDVLSTKNRKFRILTAGFIFSAITISILVYMGLDMYVSHKKMSWIEEIFRYLVHIAIFGFLGMAAAYCINWKEFRGKKDGIKRKE